MVILPTVAYARVHCPDRRREYLSRWNAEVSTSLEPIIHTKILSASTTRISSGLEWNWKRSVVRELHIVQDQDVTANSTPMGS
jgi:hypothetical protein